MPNHSIIASTFSEKHNYRVGKNLLKAIQLLEIENLNNQPSMHGRPDDEWYKYI